MTAKWSCCSARRSSGACARAGRAALTRPRSRDTWRAVVNCPSPRSGPSNMSPRPSRGQGLSTDTRSSTAFAAGIPASNSRPGVKSLARGPLFATFEVMSFFRFWTFAGCVGLALAAAAAPSPAMSSNAHFQFREPRQASYRLETPSASLASTNARPAWVKAWPENGSRYPVEFGSQVALQLKPGTDIQAILKGSSLQLSRIVATDFFVLEAGDAPTALSEAQRLAARPEVLVSCPIRRRQQIRKHGPYAAEPNDTYFFDQWNLENRAGNGAPLGVDLNVRAAWPITRGAGSIVTVADDGVELTHPEFVARASNDLHFYFDGGNGSTNAMPTDPDDNHSTIVAGLALAEGNNHRGMSGVAPEAQLASWKIFLGNKLSATEVQMMDMFQYRSNIVSVENHSWGNADLSQLAPTPLESVGISNAIAFVRGALGVVMVRSAGNGRGSVDPFTLLPDQSDDAND